MPRCVRPFEPLVRSASPCMTKMSAPRCSIPCTTTEHAVGVADDHGLVEAFPARPHATNEHLAVADVSITDQMIGYWLPAEGHDPIGLKPATTLSRKDWHWAAIGAVLLSISGAGALPILPRRPLGRGGASVVRRLAATNRTEDLNGKVCEEVIERSADACARYKANVRDHWRAGKQERDPGSKQSLVIAMLRSCPCRKSNPSILVVEPAEDWLRADTSDCLDDTCYRHVFA